MHHPHPAPQPGYLMQKIIACEKRVIPSHCAELCLGDCGLVSLQSICAAGAAACTLCDGRLQLTIPVSVCACDACGHCRTLSTTIHVKTHPLDRCACEDARSMLLALPCVRLIRAEATGGGCFRAQVQIQLEMYLLRYETLCHTPCKPACPPLPLYPPPIR